MMRIAVLLIMGSIFAINSCAQVPDDLVYPFKESSLGGVVKSQAGELLEGILVRAKREAGPVAYSVISDAAGTYRFPKLEPGSYVVETPRAEGLEPGKEKVQIRAGVASRVDFTLGPAKDMIQQMSAADWALNLPELATRTGAEPYSAARLLVGRCTTCHNLYTLMKFRFDKDGWAKIIRQMDRTFSTGGPPIPQYYSGLSGSGAGTPEGEGGRQSEEQIQALAEYLAKVRGPEPMDLSQAKILPRPTGRSTRTLITEYDIPYPEAEPHDMGLDRFGNVWWTDWRWPYLGKLDPQTGAMKYWEAPRVNQKREGLNLPKKEAHPSTFQVVFDEEDNLWTAISWTGALAKFDTKAEKFTETWVFPDRGPRHLTVATGAGNPDHKRGRIWFGQDDYAGTGSMGFYVPKTGQFTLYYFPPGQNGTNGTYGRIIDSKGNGYTLKPSHGAIDRIDGETGEFMRYLVPAGPNSFPRRGDHDSEDRIWFSEWISDLIGVLDPRTGQITEYKYQTPLAKPYAVKPDLKTGLVWTTEFLTDRMAVLDPPTGEIREYLLPTKDSAIRMLDTNSVGDHSVVWFGALPEYEDGKIVKFEAW